MTYNRSDDNLKSLRCKLLKINLKMDYLMNLIESHVCSDELKPDLTLVRLFHDHSRLADIRNRVRAELKLCLKKRK